MPSHEKTEVSVLKPDSQVLLWFDSKLYFQPSILQLPPLFIPHIWAIPSARNIAHSALATQNVSCVFAHQSLTQL